MKPSRIILFAYVVCLFFTNPAFGQTRASEKELRTKAEQYFARGEVLFESEDYIKAAEAFLLAYETMPHPAVLLNAALSFEKAGNLPQAILIYEKYMLAIQEEGGDDENVVKRIDELNGKVGKLAISAQCEDPKCRILVDGLDRGVPPVAVTVMPGSHKVEALTGEQLEAIKYVLVVAGEVLSVHLKDEPEPEQQKISITVTQQEFKTVEPILEEDSEPKLKLGVPFWISSGVAVAGIGTGVGVWLSVFKDKKDFDDAATFDEKQSIKDDVKTKYIVEGVAFGVAGCGIIAATIFAILDNKPSKEDDSADISLTLGPEIGVNFKF